MNTSPNVPPSMIVHTPWLWLLAGLSALAACGGSTIEGRPIHAPGPALTGYYGTRLPSELAYGGPQAVASVERSTQLDLTPYLKPDARRERAPAQPRKPRPMERALPQPLVARPQEPAPKADAVNETQAKSAAPPAALFAQQSDAQRYAQREQQASKQAQYRGGDVVVISATTILIVLLVVLIILLLT